MRLCTHCKNVMDMDKQVPSLVPAYFLLCELYVLKMAISLL